MPASPLSPPPPRSASAARAAFQRAVRCQELDQRLEAAREYFRALELDPGFSEAAFNLGLLFQQMGQPQEAAGCYRHALQYRPDLAAAWGNLGVALREMGQGENAIASFREALRLDPGQPAVSNSLGNALLAHGYYAEAIVCFRDALRQTPANPGFHLNLGNALRASGRLTEAVEVLRHSIALRPDYAEAHWDLAFALLLQGDFVEGFREYEWRWRRADYSGREYPAPVWRGEELAGRTILVHTEQGAGDAIQFVRFADVLAQRGARVLLECPASLAELFATTGVSQVICRGGALPAFDYHIPLLGLPHRLGTTLETIPGSTPYLRPPSFRRVSLPAGPQGRPVLRVGVAWRGNPQHSNDRQRSIPLALMEPLFDVSGVAFYSLQVSPAGAGVERAPALVSLDGLLRDFADTAGVMAELDLVISVDTSVAHLAGALGRPAWVLLPFAADWRWLVAREDSPWYPTARLFRQAAAGDWAGVVGRTRDALIERVRAA